MVVMGPGFPHSARAPGRRPRLSSPAPARSARRSAGRAGAGDPSRCGPSASHSSSLDQESPPTPPEDVGPPVPAEDKGAEPPPISSPTAPSTAREGKQVAPAALPPRPNPNEP